MRCKSIFVFILGIFLIGIASASFSFFTEGSSMIDVYNTSSDYIKASVNISFNNESLNSTFRDSLGNSIKLGDLLRRGTGYNYSFNDISNTTINSSFNVLRLDNANFSLLGTSGNFTYQLNFSGIQIFKRTIGIAPNVSLIEEEVNTEIEKKYDQLDTSRASIRLYDLYVQNILNEFLNMVSLENDLEEAKAQYEDAGSDEEYTGVLSNLSHIEIPERISETVIADSITFYPNRETINLNVLKNIRKDFNDNYSNNEEGYIDAIYLWNENYSKTTVFFKEILINYESDAESTLRIFRFEFDINTNEDAYFIIRDIGNLKFEGNISLTEGLGYYYINIKDVPNEIIFSTTENVSFLNIPVFVSTTLNNLEPVEVGAYKSGEEEGKLSKWVLFGLIVLLLLLVAIVTYVMLQIWYRKKYEDYLFKNRNNLFNIMTYIQGAKKKGMEREDIIKNLKNANWTGEQISYALRKYEGKKILGIIEKPFKKVIEEIEKTPQTTDNTKV